MRKVYGKSRGQYLSKYQVQDMIDRANMRIEESLYEIDSAYKRIALIKSPEKMAGTYYAVKDYINDLKGQPIPYNTIEAIRNMGPVQRYIIRMRDRITEWECLKDHIYLLLEDMGVQVD